MFSLRVRNGKLMIDFRYRGVRCREQTGLANNERNRRRVARIIRQIDAEMELGTLDYARYFNSGIRYRLSLMRQTEFMTIWSYQAPGECGWTRNLESRQLLSRFPGTPWRMIERSDLSLLLSMPSTTSLRRLISTFTDVLPTTLRRRGSQWPVERSA